MVRQMSFLCQEKKRSGCEFYNRLIPATVNAYLADYRFLDKFLNSA